MKFSKITLKELISLIENFFKEVLNIKEEEKPKRGRPKKYSDSFIMAAFLFKNSRTLSFRDLKIELEDRLEEVPAISPLHYRFSKLDSKLMEELVEYVAKKIEKKYDIKAYKYVVADGTGFGYNTKYTQRVKRGKELRQIGSHIRIGTIVGVRKDIRKNIVLGVITGDA